MAANAAVIIARLGGRASWWGRVGDDDKGERILEDLRREGVELEDVRIVPGAVSSHSIVLGDRHSNRAIVLYLSDALDPDPAWLPLDAVPRLDAVLADNRWIDGSVAALSRARADGRPGVLDADAGADTRTIEAVRCATHAIFSKPGLAEIYRIDDPDEGLRRAADHAPFVAVTLGGNGVRWLNDNGVAGFMPAFGVEVVETVGAGDVFHGAFALALAEGMAEVDALRFAAAAAALKCSKAGGRVSFPHRAAVERLARQL